MHAVSSQQLLGLAGMLLVFASFLVKRWLWLYSLNMSGALLLTVYAYLRRDPIFTIVEAWITGFLAYRLVNELRERLRGRRPVSRGRSSGEVA
jgi:lipid-A-disaccharide synthase-like uncharacterized protein